MKFAAILSLGLSLFLTPSAFAAEGTSQLNISEVAPPSPRDLNVRLVPQVGVSSLEYTGQGGGNPGQAFSGGLTTELFTTKQRILETGVLWLRTSGYAGVGPSGTTQTVNTSEIAIPMMAKIRFYESKEQSWYAKVGALTAFEAASDHANTSAMDVMASIGGGVRLPVSKQIDLLVDATYNRGFLSAFQNQSSIHEGLLFFTGLSFGI